MFIDVYFNKHYHLLLLLLELTAYNSLEMPPTAPNSEIIRKTTVNKAVKLHDFNNGVRSNNIDSNDNIKINSIISNNNISPPVEQIDINTFKVLRIYSTIKHAADSMGLSASGILNCCSRRGKLNGGFIWRFYKGPTINCEYFIILDSHLVI